MDMKGAIAEVINGRSLTLEQAEAAMDIIMSGEATQAQIGSYLTALRMKGETADEIAGSAKSMRSHVVQVEIPVTEMGSMLVDTCGTGGDGKHTINISTTAAFVVAGHGVKVAKHGNRAASSKSGSADVLMALGGNLDLTPEQVAECVAEVGIGFMYAIHHHPAMKYAIGPRRELGQRTIFNVLGTTVVVSPIALLAVFLWSITLCAIGLSTTGATEFFAGDLSVFVFIESEKCGCCVLYLGFVEDSVAVGVKSLKKRIASSALSLTAALLLPAAALAPAATFSLTTLATVAPTRTVGLVGRSVALRRTFLIRRRCSVAGASTGTTAFTRCIRFGFRTLRRHKLECC